MKLAYMLLLVFFLPSQASIEEGPECPGIIRPISYDREESDEEPSLARPHQSPTSQPDDRDFIPYKILFLLDDTVSQETTTKFRGIFQRVNDRLSRIVRARKVKDVRIREKRYSDGGCELCDNSTIVFLEEFITRHPLCANVTSGPVSQRVNELNTHNYTLVVRVLVRWEGEGANLLNHSCVSSTIAYAQHCSPSNASYGVDHGVVMYCDIIDKTDESVDATSLHEILHILAPTLVVHTPLRKECRKILDCEKRIWKNDTRTILDKNGQLVQKYSYLATIDELRDAASAYFDCPRAEGLELNMEWNEISGRFVPDWGHWSDRLFPDELMSPRSHGSARLSNLTLSVLAAYRDWYWVDMSKAEPLFHKIKNGCDQLEKGCHSVVLEQRQNPQPTFFQPYCDSMEEDSRAITSHCSSDHKVQLQCHQFDGMNDDCSTLLGFSQSYDQAECEKATRFKHGLGGEIGASFGPNTICVTLTSTPTCTHYSTPICVLYECLRNEQSLVLQFQPKAELGSMCFVNCSADLSNRIVAGPKDASCGTVSSISLICPDYHTICDPPTTTSTSTTTTSSTKVTEVSRDPGDTPAISTPPTTVGTSSSSSALPAIEKWRMVTGIVFSSINILVVWFGEERDYVYETWQVSIDQGICQYRSALLLNFDL